MDAITRDIQQSYQNLMAGNDPAALQRYLATTPYSADQLAAATGYNAADLQSALNSARTSQPTAEQWAPRQTESTLGGMGTHVYGGDPGVSQGYNPNSQYQAAKLGGFRGSLSDWQAQQAEYRKQATQDMAANPGVVAGGYANQGQMQAAQQSDPYYGTKPSGFSTGPLMGGSAVGASPAVGASSGNGLVQGVNVNQYQQNPYLSQMGDVLTGRVTDNLQRNIMPGIRSNAVAAGSFGGSRQGVVEANAMKDANQTISDALTGAYFQDFTNQMNRNLAQYGQNQNFYSNQRGQDLQQTALGANLFQQGNQGWLSQGQGMYGLGQTQQQAPWQVINNANAGLGQWSGYGTTTSANQGGGAQGALGGAMAGGQLGSLWGGAGLNSNGSAYQTGAGTMSDLKSLGVF